MHYGLALGDAQSQDAMHALPYPVPNYATPSIHGGENSGYDSGIYPSPMTSLPVLTRKPIGETLKQTVLAQDSLNHVCRTSQSFSRKSKSQDLLNVRPLSITSRWC
jgi:hypothetical protein